MPTETHIQKLVNRYANGRAIREIERENGLAAGALGNFLKGSRQPTLPQFKVMQRFAQALGAPLAEVSAAFVADAGIPGIDYSEQEVELIRRWRALDGDDRRRLLGLLHTLEAVAAEPALDVDLASPR